MNMTAEQLSALFPELALIQNRDLREKTVQVWLQACQDCDWDSLEEIPFSAGFTPTPDNLVYHTRLRLIRRTVCTQRGRNENIGINQNSHAFSSSFLNSLTSAITSSSEVRPVRSASPAISC